MTISIVGILAVVVGPRFFSRGIFESRGFFDQATETVRYAQKLSVAWRRQVYVCVTPNSLSAGLDSACGTPLNNPATNAPLTVSAPSGVTLAGAGFSFTAPAPTQAGGRPDADAQVVISINSTVAGDPARRIVIERETGYVHN